MANRAERRRLIAQGKKLRVSPAEERDQQEILSGIQRGDDACLERLRVMIGDEKLEDMWKTFPELFSAFENDKHSAHKRNAGITEKKE